jgi:hypothetical protein
LLKICCVPATSAILPRVSFFFSFRFLLQWPFTVPIKQTRQAVRAIKQFIFIDVYGFNPTVESLKVVLHSGRLRPYPQTLG